MHDDKYLNYSFRLGVNFRDRPGDFDSSGDCGHAPTVRNPDTDPMPAAGIDFQCDVDCDGGGIAVNLANNDNSCHRQARPHAHLEEHRSGRRRAALLARRRRRQDIPARPREPRRMQIAGHRPQGTRRDAAQVNRSPHAPPQSLAARSRHDARVAARGPRQAETGTDTSQASKVVYHLADLDKVDFVLGNIANHYKGMGGPENVTIALVIHGPALKAFLRPNASPDVAKHMRGVREVRPCSQRLHSRHAGAERHARRICCRASPSPTKAAWCGSRNCRRKATPICGRESLGSCPQAGIQGRLR